MLKVRFSAARILMRIQFRKNNAFVPRSGQFMSYAVQISWFLPCFWLVIPTESRCCFQGAVQSAAVSHRSWSTHDAEWHQRLIRLGSPVRAPAMTASRADSSGLNKKPARPNKSRCTNCRKRRPIPELRRLRRQTGNPHISIMMSRRDLKSVDMQIHIPRNIG